jgi:hypothetical protein
VDAGVQLVRRLAGGGGGRRVNPTFEAAATYTRAMHLAAKTDKADKQKARELLEEYLGKNSPQSLWWPTAYERYEAVCKDLGVEPKGKDAFKKAQPPPLRLVAGVRLKSGVEVNLGDDVEDVAKKLGKGKETVAMSGTNLRRWRYEKEGVELLVTEEVMAITLIGPDAPALPLRPKGFTTAPAVEVKVGMAVDELEKLLGEAGSRPEIAAAEVYYRYYREQGVAVRVIGGKVAEVVVVQIPE